MPDPEAYCSEAAAPAAAPAKISISRTAVASLDGRLLCDHSVPNMPKNAEANIGANWLNSPI